MHELSIALGIVDVIETESARLGRRQVDAVHVRIGRLSGVVPEALVASFEIAVEDTPLEATRLVIEDAPVLVQCDVCGGPRGIRSTQDFRCVDCDTPAGEVVAGRELLVVALELSGEPS
jgi:hydrogenase nickel incorporation protein HypA/HybF